MSTSEEIITRLSSVRFPLQNEKLMQQELAKELPGFEAEWWLDKRSIIDFFYEKEGIGIEVKIQGSRKEIYRQCARYCEFPQLRVLILLTNRSMGLPEFINDTPCYVVNLGKAWL